MAMDSQMHRGVIHGKTIELVDPIGLPEGQEVTVTVQPFNTPGQTLPPGEGIRKSAGAWAEDAEELDVYLEWNRQQRKVGRSQIEDRS